jgi:hypothetical protein
MTASRYPDRTQTGRKFFASASEQRFADGAGGSFRMLHCIADLAQTKCIQVLPDFRRKGLNGLMFLDDPSEGTSALASVLRRKPLLVENMQKKKAHLSAAAGLFKT